MSAGSFFEGLAQGKMMKDSRKRRDRELSIMEAMASNQAGSTPGATPAITHADGGVSVSAARPGDLNFPASLIRTESGGKWDARNDVQGSGGKGHFGRLQFSRGRMADAIKAGVLPEGTTPEAFMQSPDLQRAAENWHFSDISRFIESNNLGRYVGREIGGVTMTEDGMKAVAHLGGNTGLRRFLETGGRYNPADSNGTSLSDYARIHGGAAPASAGTQRQPSARARASVAIAPPEQDTLDRAASAAGQWFKKVVTRGNGT